MPLEKSPQLQDDNSHYECHNCGAFTLSHGASEILGGNRLALHDHARLAYALRKRGAGTVLTTELVDAILQGTTLPDASTLQDNLLVYMGKTLASPGETVDLWAPALRAALGARTSRSIEWVTDQAIESGLLQGRPIKTIGGADDYRVLNTTLTLKGWERVRDLQDAAKESRKAFMAMKFGDPVLNRVFSDYFKPAISQTGFDLIRMDEAPRAGLIDDQLRLEIRTCRFLVADLSHGNNGAYWEAGYAEGLGRPVIYTCRKDVFDDQSKRPHFDTNHYLTVVWDPLELQSAVAQLKAVVRVTLPAESVLVD